MFLTASLASSRLRTWTYGVPKTSTDHPMPGVVLRTVLAIELVMLRSLVVDGSIVPLLYDCDTRENP